MYLAAYMCNIFGSQVHWTLKNSDTQENTLQILIWRACMCIYSPISGWYFSVTCVYLYVVEMKTEKGSRNGILENGENVMCMSEADMYLIFCVFWNEYLNKADDVKYSCSSFNFMNHSLEQHLIIQNTENFDLLWT